MIEAISAGSSIFSAASGVPLYREVTFRTQDGGIIDFFSGRELAVEDATNEGSLRGQRIRFTGNFQNSGE